MAPEPTATRVVVAEAGLRRRRGQDTAIGTSPEPKSSPKDHPTKPCERSPRALTSFFWVTSLCIVCAGSCIGFLNVRERRSPARGVQTDVTEWSPDVLVTVYSYDRPSHLQRLLTDIRNCSKTSTLRVAVHVIDDNSLGCVAASPAAANYYDADLDDGDSHSSALDSVPALSQLFDSKARSDAHGVFCPRRSRFRDVARLFESPDSVHWRFYASPYRHGRRRYWHLVRIAHRLARVHAPSAKYFVFLPDDVRLSAGFLRRATEAWDAVEGDEKMTLMLHIEESRENAAVWTDLSPTRENDDLFRIGWVESGNFIAGRRFMEYVNWSFPRVPIQRWVDNPPISSGVGAFLSESLHRDGLRMYRTAKSLVAHVGVRHSKMNSAFRDPSQLAHVTRHFADGDARYEQLLDESSTVVASLASTWNRELSLHGAVESLAPQVDHINVYLNGYDAVPAFLNAPYITAQLSSRSPRGDIGDVGKFFWANEVHAEFHLTADDDILYPDDYVATLLRAIKSYAPPAIVGAHGITLLPDKLSPPGRRRGHGYYGSREVLMGVDMVPAPQPVHILGTGTLLYRVADVGPVALDAFPKPNMADIWFAILAQRRGIPLVCVAHAQNWLRDVPGTFHDSIYSRTARRRRRADRDQTAAVLSAAPWHVFPPTPASN